MIVKQVIIFGCMVHIDVYIYIHTSDPNDPCFDCKKYLLLEEKQTQDKNGFQVHRINYEPGKSLIPWMDKAFQKTGINYQPQLVSRISSINSMLDFRCVHTSRRKKSGAVETKTTSDMNHEIQLTLPEPNKLPQNKPSQKTEGSHLPSASIC